MNIAAARQRCHHHPVREAIARCPECGRFFCRECIVEHEDRVLCASCLGKLVTPLAATGRAGSFRRMLPLTGGAVGLLVAWLVFYLVGRALLEVPDDFHAEKLWKRAWLNSELVKTP